MKPSNTYRTPSATAFRLENAPVLHTRTLTKSMMSVTEIRCDEPNFGMTSPMPYDDAYHVCLQIRECPEHELWEDGRPSPTTPHVAGVTSIFDLRRDPIAYVKSACHSLHFYLPCKALDQFTEEAGLPRIGDLRATPGLGEDDPISRHLLMSLIPVLQKPGEVYALFVDHVAAALIANIAQRYGGISFSTPQYRGGLAPHLEKRAKEILSTNLNGEISLERLASECGLSVRHFTRAFRQSTGVPPHRWLMQHRVERARAMMLETTIPLADIALSCGFADQSHFTRVFTALLGIGPGAWRRICK